MLHPAHFLEKVGGALLFSACLSVHPSVRLLLWYSNLIIFHRISSKFHIWIASIKLLPKFEFGFCPTKDNKMAVKMATACQFVLVDTLP